MLKLHNTNSLEGKVAAGLLDRYRVDYKNLKLSSIIAGFHRSYGHRNEGITMALEIVNNIEDDTDNIQDRNLLVWNLYSLIDEFIEEENLDGAMQLASRAERNWSRDIVAGDEVGVYHVSWLEQIWHKQAEIKHLIGDWRGFHSLTDKIISSRLCLFEKAWEVTGETILYDRCTYSCLELMAFEARKRDIKKAILRISAAIMVKSGVEADNRVNGDQVLERKSLEAAIESDEKELERAFAKRVKRYCALPVHSYDRLCYTYCSSCSRYRQNTGIEQGWTPGVGICLETNRAIGKFSCCSKYINESSCNKNLLFMIE